MELLQVINTYAQYGAIGFIIIGLGMIKLPKIEINFWSLIGRTLGRAINGEIMEEVKAIGDRLDNHIKIEEEEAMRNVRQRILHFNDEILSGKRHSKEHFNEILEDINVYETYCTNHPNFKNNRAVLAISTIKDVYKECLREHDFLTYKKEAK